MSNEYIVYCDECPTEADTPRKWRWLCEECADECSERHEAQTGHSTRVTKPATLADITINLNESMIKRVQRITGGW